MKSTSSSRTFVSIGATIALVITTAAPASASITWGPGDTGDEITIVSADLHWSDTDITGFLLFGTGALAVAHPELLTKARIAPQAVTEAEIAEVTERLVAVDPTFSTVVTDGVQSGDPYRVRTALLQLGKDVRTISTGTVDGRTYSAQCAFWVAVNVAFALEVAVAVVLVVVAYYAPEDEASQLALDEASAAIAHAI